MHDNILFLLPFFNYSNIYIFLHIHTSVRELEASYLVGHVDDHVLHVNVHIIPTMLAELLYPLQDGNTPLHIAVEKGYTLCMEYLISIRGMDVNIKNDVSWAH